jgi:hypothetical protein
LDHEYKEGTPVFVLINAGAGTGKSTAIDYIVRQLDSVNGRVLCPTHRTKSQFCQEVEGSETWKAETLDKFIVSTSSSAIPSYLKVLLLDEVSMMNANHWRKLHYLHAIRPDISIIAMGDLSNQLRGVDGKLKMSVEHSQHLKLLFGFELEQPQISWRYDDCRVLKEMVELTRNFNFDWVNDWQKSDDCEIYLTWTNRLRDHINKLKIASADKGKIVYPIKATDETPNFSLFVNLPLIGADTKHGITNGTMYTVVGLSSLKCNAAKRKVDLVDEHGQKLALMLNQVEGLVEPAYAVTCHKLQGSTITKKFGICEWPSIYAYYNRKGVIDDARRWLYTAISRCRTKNNMFFCSIKPLAIVRTAMAYGHPISNIELNGHLEEDYGKSWSVDHIIPQARGGTNELNNLQALSVGENSRKKDKLPNDYY